MCLKFGTPKTINFPFETNGKFIILGVPIFKHMTGVYVTSLNTESEETFPVYPRPHYQKKTQTGCLVHSTEPWKGHFLSDIYQKRN